MAPISQPTVKSVAPSRAWDALTPPLAQWILDAVSDLGYKRMTPVQASTIPEFMQNRDVVVEVSISWRTLYVCCAESHRQSLAAERLLRTSSRSSNDSFDWRNH